MSTKSKKRSFFDKISIAKIIFQKISEFRLHARRAYVKYYKVKKPVWYVLLNVSHGLSKISLANSEVPSFRQNESSRQETVSTDRIIVSMLSSVRHSAQHLSRLQTIPGPHFELKPLVCVKGIPLTDDTVKSLRIPTRSGFNRHCETTRLLA